MLVQTAVTGTLGRNGILAAPVSPMLTVARMTLGRTGGVLAIVMLVALPMIDGLAGPARAMHSLAVEGNLPRMFGRLNPRGTPVLAMVVIAVFNLGLILLKTPTAILAASAIGYVCANGISLFAYVKAGVDPGLAALERPFRAPAGWSNVALCFGLFINFRSPRRWWYRNSLESGWTATAVGFGVLASYVPLWLFSQREPRS